MFEFASLAKRKRYGVPEGVPLDTIMLGPDDKIGAAIKDIINSTKFSLVFSHSSIFDLGGAIEDVAGYDACCQVERIYVQGVVRQPVMLELAEQGPSNRVILGYAERCGETMVIDGLYVVRQWLGQYWFVANPLLANELRAGLDIDFMGKASALQTG